MEEMKEAIPETSSLSIHPGTSNVLATVTDSALTRLL